MYLMVGILKRDARGYGEGRVGSRVGGPEGVSREEVGVERAGGTEAVAPRVRRPEKSWKEGEAEGGGGGGVGENLEQPHSGLPGLLVSQASRTRAQNNKLER